MGTTGSNSTIEIGNELALTWVDYWARQPECNGQTHSAIFLTGCRQDLRMVCGLPPSAPPRASYLPLPGSSGKSVAAKPAQHSPFNTVLDRMPDAFMNSVSSPGNLAGNAMGGMLALDAMYHSLPTGFFVRVQGGEWELFDANKSARSKAFGKKGKARFPPRMMIRARNVSVPQLPPGAVMRGNQLRVPAVGAKTVAEALRISRVNQFQPISDKAYRALAGRRLAAGTPVGAALAFGPTLYMDVNAAGGLGRIYNDSEARRQFALASAKNQSTNAVGLAAGVAVGAALVAGGVASAPVLLVAGLVGGVLAQTGFVSFGGDEWAQDVMRDLLD